MKQKKLIAALLFAALLLSAAAPAAFAADSALKISTAEQLREFAINCKLDSYSDGLIVILEKDIDLSGEAFDPIGSFSGSFNGKGHTIRGLTLSTDGSYQGLFRYVTAKGSIRNLRVEGEIAPETLRIAVGGIVGANYGVIDNCSFAGTVSGTRSVGLICGENYGTVSGCTAVGSVSAKHSAGGICGYNEGVISGCANNAGVNNTVESSQIDIEELSVADLTTFKLVTANDDNSVTDVGGICGYSSGTITDCTNDALIGYQHYGYNIGGIVGRQSGYIENCVNRGEVLGKKDVAGICGQMEPYMILTQIESIIEELQALTSSLNSAMAHLGENSSEAGEVIGSIQTDAGSAAENAQGMDANSKDPVLPENKDNGSDDTSFGEKVENAGDYAGGIKDQIGDDTIGNIGSLPDGGGLTDDDYNNLIGAGGTVIGDASGSISEKVEQKKEQEAQYNAYQAALNANMSSMAGNISKLNTVLAGSMGDLAADMMGVNGHFAKLSMLVTALLSGESISMTDISEYDSENVANGKIYNCVNEGTVDGDINIGGIGGDMGIEMDYDLEGTLLSEVSEIELVKNSYETRCVARDCVNRGEIKARKNYCGGIVGYQEIGFITGCQSYGFVNAEDGTYVGGVAGYSTTRVDNSFAMCSIAGDKYVGGIVGWGYKVSGCGSIVELTKLAASCGAVAGWADTTEYEYPDDFNKSKADAEQLEAAKIYNIRDNFYIHDSLGGIDDLSYGGKAYPLSYEEMVKRDNIPEDFKISTLHFVADGKLVDTLSFGYGETLDTALIPEVPEKEGYCGYWEDFDETGLFGRQTVHAVYLSHASAIASELCREGKPTSLLLAEGIFSDNCTLEVSDYPDGLPVIRRAEINEHWLCEINGNKLENGEYQLRYLEPEHLVRGSKLYIYVLGEDNVWRLTPTEQKGSYLVFSASGDRVVFCAVEYHSSAGLIIALCVAAALAGAYWVMRKKGIALPKPKSFNRVFSKN